MKIVILTPFNLERDIFNLLHPLAEHYGYEIISNDMLGRMMAQLKDYSILDTVERNMMVALTEPCYTFFNEQDVIYIGFCSVKADVDFIVSYMPEMVEAQEALLDLSFNFRDNFILSQHSDYTTYDEQDVLNIVKEFIEKIAEGTKETWS